jgi:hypothetical protein
MTDYDREVLTNEVKEWLKDPAILLKARELLGGKGLSDVKISNWRRDNRAIPDTFIEGVALDFCARAEFLNTEAAQRAKLTADTFWQVFVVSPQQNVDGKHDLTVLRYWTEVKSTRHSRPGAHLTHRTWFSGSNSPVIDIETKAPHKDVLEEIGMVAVSWKLEGEQPRDLGYRLHIKSGISIRSGGSGRYEFLGGLSCIPVDRSMLIIQIPKEIIKSSTDIFDISPFARPQCIQFLPDAAPLQMIQSFLTRALDRRWLEPWFEKLGPAQTATEARVEIPLALQNELDQIDHSGRLIQFSKQVDSPAPYLCYLLVFEYPEHPPK